MERRLKHRRKTDSEDLEDQIGRYLAAHPDAADTVTGITAWWLSRQRYEDASEKVRQALERLVHEGKVVKRTKQGGLVLYAKVTGIE